VSLPPPSLTASSVCTWLPWPSASSLTWPWKAHHCQLQSLCNTQSVRWIICLSQTIIWMAHLGSGLCLWSNHFWPRQRTRLH
jgi:hypothetical protein